jgi:hypothetical protein
LPGLAAPSQFNDLVDGTPDFVAGQSDNHPLDLAPVAEAHDITIVAAPFCPRRRLGRGPLPVPVNKVGCIGK